MDDIQHWMVNDRLLLNDEKREFLLIGTCQQLAKVDPLPLRVGTMDIESKNCVRNLGAWFDLMLSMETHVNKVCSSGFYYLGGGGASHSVKFQNYGVFRTLQFALLLTLVISVT